MPVVGEGQGSVSQEDSISARNTVALPGSQSHSVGGHRRGPEQTLAWGTAALLWEEPSLGKQESRSLSSSFVIFQLCDLEDVAQPLRVMFLHLLNDGNMSSYIRWRS